MAEPHDHYGNPCEPDRDASRGYPLEPLAFHGSAAEVELEKLAQRILLNKRVDYWLRRYRDECLLLAANSAKYVIRDLLRGDVFETGGQRDAAYYYALATRIDGWINPAGDKFYVGLADEFYQLSKGNPVT